MLLLSAFASGMLEEIANLEQQPQTSHRVRNTIGERGERMFYIIMTTLLENDLPIFDVYFLGEKAETIDFFVKLEVAEGEMHPFCLVQVKTTTQDISGNGRLQTSISETDLQRLRAYPGPTYVVGIHEPTKAGYILSAKSGERPRVRTIPTTYPLDETNLRALYEEVREYWSQKGATFDTSRFSEEDEDDSIR